MCSRRTSVSVCVWVCAHVCHGFSLDLTDIKWCILLGQRMTCLFTFTSLSRELCWVCAAEVLLSVSAPFGRTDSLIALLLFICCLTVHCRYKKKSYLQPAGGAKNQ